MKKDDIINCYLSDKSQSLAEIVYKTHSSKKYVSQVISRYVKDIFNQMFIVESLSTVNVWFLFSISGEKKIEAEDKWLLNEEQFTEEECKYIFTILKIKSTLL